MTGENKPKPVNCGSCHRDVASRFRRDVHYIKQNFQCQDCHQDIHSIRKSGAGFKVAAVENCSQCHSGEDYTLLGHSGALLKGNADAASCTDCHGLHNTPYYDQSLERDKAAARENYTRRCRSCHADAKMAKRNRFSTKTVATYDDSYHGKIFNIGFPQRVAGCADCHLGHNTLPKNDLRSAMHRSNMKAACKECHKGFHDRFVSFDTHHDPLDPKRSPLLYWTNVFMIALLGGTFSFFWLHTFLWWRRTYCDKCCEGKAGFIEKTILPECRPEYREDKQIQRFPVRDRIMHVLLILSFFTLVMTGFPIKYYDSPWAKILINMWGGAYRAGLFHRIAALVLCGLFLYTLWLSLRFLFPKKQFRGSLQRLFGPDSLFPNFKDLRDIVGMFKWFFGKGEMPKFDRWTYWEKFDFLAVFWGMTAIGGSGFMLWFPEKFSYLLPGWMINVATVVHSEEAFLAAIFIFTVHFFNNHLVPNKFPLEPNVFTGRYRLDVMRHERPLEYERLVAEGRLDELKREGPGFWTQLFASAFGLASLLLGLLLTGLIFWAALFY
jgi:cytochrome b subunit of formate dehydrogenase